MRFLPLLPLILFSLPFQASSEKISWNASNYFQDNIYKTTNAELVTSEEVPLYYKIKKKSFPIDPSSSEIDLYLSFDGKGENSGDITTNYTFLNYEIQYRETDPYIKSSAFFYKDTHNIQLEGNKNSIFRPGTFIDSFTINFYVYPLNLSKNSTLFRIGSHFYQEANDLIQDQSIVATLEEGIFRCSFNNVFTGNDKKSKPLIVIESFQRVPPSKWTNLALTYDSFTGMIKIFVNGLENGILKVTQDGTVDSDSYHLYFDPANRCILEIGASYVGALDEFLIKRKAEERIVGNEYTEAGAEILSQVIKLDDFLVNLKKVAFDQYLDENGSDIRYFVRYSKTPFYADETIKSRQEVKWTPLTTETIQNVPAVYFQWKALLLPGISGKTSPNFHGITLEYEKDLPPAKPAGLKLLSTGKSLKLKWLMNSEKDLKGYKIYYGTNPGVYFGKDALEGESPVRIGKRNEFELTGLKENILYYITVTAYDDENGEHEGEFSDEVHGRVN